MPKKKKAEKLIDIKQSMSWKIVFVAFWNSFEQKFQL